jgi:hypothetical protein
LAPDCPVNAMSALGQKQKSHYAFIMSALTPTADIRAHRTICRKVPNPDITGLIEMKEAAS